jgi:hypothetical protein
MKVIQGKLVFSIAALGLVFAGGASAADLTVVG